MRAYNFETQITYTMKLPFDYAKNLMTKVFNNDYETFLKALTLREEQLVLSFKVRAREPRHKLTLWYSASALECEKWIKTAQLRTTR